MSRPNIGVLARIRVLLRRPRMMVMVALSGQELAAVRANAQEQRGRVERVEAFLDHPPMSPPHFDLIESFARSGHGPTKILEDRLTDLVMVRSEIEPPPEMRSLLDRVDELNADVNSLYDLLPEDRAS